MKTSGGGGSRKKRKTEEPLACVDDLRGVPVRWHWHYRTLGVLRDRLLDERAGELAEAKGSIEPHSLHEADSATDEFDQGVR